MSLTQDEIIRMAREAGISEWAIGTGENRSSTQGRRLLRLERFASLVSEATKEKAAKVCDEYAHPECWAARDCAAAIRSMK